MARPSRTLNITDEDMAVLESASDALRERQPELAALAKPPDPADMLRQRARAVALGVAAGGLALIIILVLATILIAVLAGLFSKVFHFIA